MGAALATLLYALTVVSLPMLEDYLQVQGREWERFAWLKSRVVAPCAGVTSGRALALRSLVTPFVYRRYMDYGVFESLRQLHQKIRDEAQRRAAGRPERANDVKLSRGGIREIEFIVQLMLVVHPSVPVKSVKELIALAKARPGELNAATSGNGSGSHLALELFGRMAGVRIPATAVEHQYLLSGPIEGYTPVELGKMPTMRDPDHLVYYKPDGQGLLIGGYEPDTLAFAEDGIPVPFQRKLLDPNFDRFEQLAALAQDRRFVDPTLGNRQAVGGALDRKSVV